MFNAHLFNERLFNAGPTLAAISYIGESELEIIAEKLKGGILHLLGESNLTLSANYSVGGVAALEGTGAAVFGGGKLQKVTVVLSGSGALTTVPVRRRFGSAAFIGEGLLEVIASRILFSGIDYVGESFWRAKGVAAAFFIDSDGRFSPLDVLVLGDSRKDLLPAIKDYAEIIPGKHGDILLDTKLDPRILELHVATDEGLSPAEREQLKRTIARYLNPATGTKALIFADDLDKTFNVKYSGRIDLNQYPTWFDFVIPFRLRNPYILETFDQLLTGSGTAANNGTADAHPVIEIAGPDTDPSLTIGTATLAYTGEIDVGETLIINTKARTAYIGSVNVSNNYNRAFPKLPPGETSVTAGSNVIIRWRGRWV